MEVAVMTYAVSEIFCHGEYQRNVFQIYATRLAKSL